MRRLPRPPVPSWIRVYPPAGGWTNVFALVPSNEHLYGTETLFGDWDGRTLLLGKDGAPTPVIRALRDRGESRPWRHAQRERNDPGGYRTNERLASIATSLPGGKLYGSATANLLYDDPRWSRSLPGLLLYRGTAEDTQACASASPGPGASGGGAHPCRDSRPPNRRNAGPSGRCPAASWAPAPLTRRPRGRAP
jgi:hypothetical protein